MDYLSACYWQQAKNRSSLLLQQYVCEGVVVCFVCVCGGRDGEGRAGGYMTGQLLQWFRALDLKRLVRRTERELGRAMAGLKAVVDRADGDLASAGLAKRAADTALAGVFCVGGAFFLFYRGRQGICLINTSFGRAHVARLGERCRELAFLEGNLEPDIGLLFAVGSFWEHISEQMIGEGLSVREARFGEQLEKRLNELGEEAARRGGKDLAAVFLRTGGGKRPAGERGAGERGAGERGAGETGMTAEKEPDDKAERRGQRWSTRR